MSKKLLHRFIALLLMLTLGYVQVVLVHHQQHSSSISSQDSFSKAHPDTPKCDICDYHLTKRLLDAILVSKTILLTFPTKSEPVSTKKEAFLLPSFHNNLSNRGPPKV